MARNHGNPFSTENVCRILLKNGLISDDQKKEILSKQAGVRKKLERSRIAGRTRSSTRSLSSLTIIDVIASLKLNRADDPEKELDEESIY